MKFVLSLQRLLLVWELISLMWYSLLSISDESLETVVVRDSSFTTQCPSLCSIIGNKSVVQVVMDVLQPPSCSIHIRTLLGSANSYVVGFFPSLNRLSLSSQRESG